MNKRRMFRANSQLRVFLVVLGIALVVLGANSQNIKGENGMKDSGSGVPDRTSAGGCRGCSPSHPENCKIFIWYQGWTSNTGYSCTNCGRSFKDIADLKCKGFEQSAEDDLDSWVLKNCGVRVNCESTRVQSSNITGTKRKRYRFLLCDKCRFIDLKYTCTYDYLCTALLR